ncbi:response regulator [Paenibacillus anaericanus]|uniref:Response regulator n=1 Tax=Paenibacillus anaericanus TaxID=170367 RepID=A0A3S1DKD0_9BACL|nr:helix-turn-helix domain-containing protein [Paenibacillus anaericanus]RUT46672.1 response regulator [Paenibacillus anaericanus]
MYRLLIVDDEPVIVNGLVHLFQEDPQFDFDICKAYSSSEALEIAKKTKLDILISDIRMPQKNGLQLVDEIIYYWPLCRVIFLTGYSEFDYVYEAIRKNVDNYILKTEGMEPIFQAVKSAVDKLEEENRRRLQLEKAQMHYQIANSFLKGELMERMLGGESIASLLSDSRYKDVDFSIAFDRPSFFLVGIVDRLDDHKFKIPPSVKRIFRDHLPVSIACEEVIYDDRVFVWLLQPDEGLLNRFCGGYPDLGLNWNGIVAYMRGILELVQNECEELLGACVSFGISGNLQNYWESIHLQVEAVHTLISKRTLLGQHMLILDLEKLSQHEDTVHKVGGFEQDDFKTLIIEQVHQFVQENLSGDVSLTSIAEEVHLNPSYLSRYYKQTTGQNLIEYIQSTKLHVALQLMENTALKLNEIAIRVGFESPSYFTTFFKRKMGLSPQEYRNSK